MSEMPKYLTDAGRDNDALNSAVGVLLTKQAMPYASTQSILWDAIKDYAERAEERSPSHASLVEENKRMREALAGLIEKYEEIVLDDDAGRSLKDIDLVRAKEALNA